MHKDASSGHRPGLLSSILCAREERADTAQKPTKKPSDAQKQTRGQGQ